MNKVKMLASFQGYNDVNGINDTKPTYYEAGREYEIGDGLLADLLKAGLAELVEHKAIEASPENKASVAAPENKKKHRFF